MFSVPPKVKISRTQEKAFGYIRDASHFVEATQTQGRCGQCGQGRVSTRCSTCFIYLHVKVNQNCFSLYHYQQKRKDQVRLSFYPILNILTKWKRNNFPILLFYLLCRLIQLSPTRMRTWSLFQLFRSTSITWREVETMRRTVRK